MRVYMLFEHKNSDLFLRNGGKILLEIKDKEIGAVAGGDCKCMCVRKVDGTDSNEVPIGNADSLKDCARFCEKKGWFLGSCFDVEGTAKKHDL